MYAQHWLRYKTGKYTKLSSPVEWIKIHNLPDHVFFSHAQHVRAGKVQCQTCHGPIQEMDEVKQFADKGIWAGASIVIGQTKLISRIRSQETQAINFIASMKNLAAI